MNPTRRVLNDVYPHAICHLMRMGKREEKRADLYKIASVIYSLSALESPHYLDTRGICGGD